MSSSRHPDALFAVRDGEPEATDHHDHERREHTDEDRETHVADVHAGVFRQAAEGDRLRVQPAPAAEADEDEVTDGGRHEAGQEDRDRRGAETDRSLHHQHATDDLSAEQRRDGSERAGIPEHSAFLCAEPCRGG